MAIPADFIIELKKSLVGEIRIDPASRVLYSTDASIYQIEPLGVVLPRTQEDLHAVISLASKYRIPVLPRGSGSSLAGQAIGEALILDCSRWLDKIIDIDPAARSASVEPGVLLSTLNQVAGKYGLQFGPDPASAERATMGGVIGNNATGAHSILYGMTADHLTQAEVVFSDGSLAVLSEIDLRTAEKICIENSDRYSEFISAACEIRTKTSKAIKKNYPATWRNSAGYRLNYLLPWSPSRPPQWIEDIYPPVREGTINPARLLAGSEGTLAVIRRATVQLVQKPKNTILGVISYGSIVEACEAVPDLLKHNPSAIELLPAMIINLARTVPAYAAQMGWVKGNPGAMLVVEFSGDEVALLKKAISRLHPQIIIAESPKEQAQVWNVRKVGLGILDSRPQSARPIAFIEDCAVPLERLGEFVREVERILSAHNTQVGIYAHASAGCLHIKPILDLKIGQGVKALRTIAEEVLALTMRMGGVMSSEHGDGILRAEWLQQIYGEEVIAAMRSLKHAADPLGLLNPRKMNEAPPMDTNLRYGPTYQAQVWKPALDFSSNGGLVTAIEQCNGQGVCRKIDGIMCPSYQATREEMHSTRGRANLLRALISQSSLLSQQHPLRNHPLSGSVAEALDLCLACKGCKAECPSGVDMAKLKFAFEAEYYKTHRRQLRDYLFGYFQLTAGILSFVAPISNRVLGISWLKSISEHTMGITAQRPYPKFTNERAHPGRHTGRPKIIYLSDAFNHYVDPKVEQAAFDILDILGFDIYVLPVIGAGASLLSMGFLEAAHLHAQRVLSALVKIDPHASYSIVGIEPPEIYSLKHDYFDLFPNQTGEISRRVKNVWLLDEYLVRCAEFNDLRVAIELSKNIDRNTQVIKFHPHCHQHSEGPALDGLPYGSDATITTLRTYGYEVELFEAGCCGMAGTFGYETEHYQLSIKVGELRLLPSIRQLQSEIINRKIIIASTGAACRLQIQHGTGISAVHPVELIRDRLMSLSDIAFRGGPKPAAVVS